MEIRLFYIFSLVNLAFGTYMPTGDEVQPGSVLLPATRRGRYLANIVRRQAVDGTGIKFNKDADRINAESKKKLDVLSPELLPYIIAEQDRRATLHKRIMVAIQNGEKGITIAEMRNKPPLIVKRGVFYRCPANRNPKEPDGSGFLICEENIPPKKVIYDSCLSAEDKPLYKVERSRKYFFCNRQSPETDDLPHNTTVVIGCPPRQRTALNYTQSKCTLDTSDDVVVHYRYYPDRSYKNVQELDPDNEVCDHWNPCQIGYIFSISPADDAIDAEDLWNSTEPYSDYESDEIVPAIPEDSVEEAVSPLADSYTSSRRTVKPPQNSVIEGIQRADQYGKVSMVKPKYYTADLMSDGNYSIQLKYPKFKSSYYGVYSAKFKPKSRRSAGLLVAFLTLVQGALNVKQPQISQSMTGMAFNTTIAFDCNACNIIGIMVRSVDGSVYNLPPGTFSFAVPSTISINIPGISVGYMGDYFAIMNNGDGNTERVKITTVQAPQKDTGNTIKLTPAVAKLAEGERFENTIKYDCNNCDLVDVMSNGVSVLDGMLVTSKPKNSEINIYFSSFKDSYAGVMIAIFKIGDVSYKKVIAEIENSAPEITLSPENDPNPPAVGSEYLKSIQFSCTDCSVNRVVINGISLPTDSAKAMPGLAGIYRASKTSITIDITAFVDDFVGVYQAQFRIGDANITKTIMTVGESNSGGEAADTGTEAAEENTTEAVGDTTEGGNSTEPIDVGTAETSAPGNETIGLDSNSTVSETNTTETAGT